MAERGYSLRRACGLGMANPKTVRREKAPGDAELCDRLHVLAAERRRFGCRRRGILLRRKGVAMSRKKLCRLYREEGLPQGPNQRWSLDFIVDALGWARRFRIQYFVEDFTREASALVVDISIGGRRLLRALDALIARRGKPAVIVSDSGAERPSRAALEWGNRSAWPGTTSRREAAAERVR